MLRDSTGKEFEAAVKRALKRKYLEKDGWQVIPQKLLHGQGIACKADFCVDNERKRKRVIVEAKAGKSLTTSDLRQLKDYKRQAKAQEAVFYVSHHTQIPDSIKNAATKSGIGIQRTRFSKRGVW